MKTLFENSPLGGRPNPLNDYLFYRVMGKKGDEFQLLGFLNAVLNRSGKDQIESLEIMEDRTFIRDIMDGKSCSLDILAILRDGTKVNIEVQVSDKGNMERRSLFYWGKVYLKGLKKGQDYKELPNVIAINIVNYNFPQSGNFHTSFHLREDADPSLILSSALEIHFINMVKWRKLKGKDIINNPLHRWLSFFDENSPPELIEEVVNMDNAVAVAYKSFEEAMEDEEAYDEYWRNRINEHDRVSEINYATEKGMEQGVKQGREEIAKKLIARGRPLEEIIEDTGLSEEAIEAIQKG